MLIKPPQNYRTFPYLQKNVYLQRRVLVPGNARVEVGEGLVAVVGLHVAVGLAHLQIIRWQLFTP